MKNLFSIEKTMPSMGDPSLRLLFSSAPNLYKNWPLFKWCFFGFGVIALVSGTAGGVLRSDWSGVYLGAIFWLAIPVRSHLYLKSKFECVFTNDSGREVVVVKSYANGPVISTTKMKYEDVLDVCAGGGFAEAGPGYKVFLKFKYGLTIKSGEYWDADSAKATAQSQKNRLGLI
jgi:hypothetical protein